jgi:hypothetical protein
MKLSLVAVAAFLQLTSAHYFFDTLVVDGKASSPNQYVRANTRQAKYNPTKWKNTRDDMTPDMADFRCNKGSFSSASKTQTAAVKAGSKLAMKLAVGARFQHPGPGLVYASRAPGGAKSSVGDGDWFKIAEMGVCNPGADFLKNAWCTWDKDRLEFTIPQNMPNGEYLIRAEHIGLHGAHGGEAEFYPTCSQIKVVGGAQSGNPGPTVKFPGAYKKNDPEVNFNLWSGYKPYKMPGPAVWGGNNRRSFEEEDAANVTEVETAPVVRQHARDLPVLN